MLYNYNRMCSLKGKVHYTSANYSSLVPLKLAGVRYLAVKPEGGPLIPHSASLE